MAVDAEVERHLGRADIRRIDEDLGHGQPALLAVEILDGELADMKRWLAS